MDAVAPATRFGIAALPVSGLAFLLFPALRPWHDEATEAGALAAFGSGAWLTSHLLGALGFLLVPLGLLAVHQLLRATPSAQLSRAAVVVCWLGVGFLLPYFGAEAFGLHAIARAAAEGQVLDVLALAEGVRMGAAAITTFGIGLVAVAVGAVMAAVAVANSGVLPRHAGVLMALGLALYLPQFFGPPWVRVAHGALLATGLFVLALAAWNAAEQLGIRDASVPPATARRRR